MQEQVQQQTCTPSACTAWGVLAAGQAVATLAACLCQELLEEPLVHLIPLALQWAQGQGQGARQQVEEGEVEEVVVEWACAGLALPQLLACSLPRWPVQQLLQQASTQQAVASSPPLPPT